MSNLLGAAFSTLYDVVQAIGTERVAESAHRS